ncbi:hypothetical protein KIK06_13950 [Nocardiopsis sp. EMB25]|uniref:hypothetical protein n=1 Tax=Nocardiopsis TaxID=2013 RepID=UPI00034BAD03|nr:MULTISPECIES: hypothetical protein [Nocardiopsis]MCY9784989.1 hypothetical protein [Nocardiopsis sp. EMB25]
MRKPTDRLPPWATAGRDAALAAFDRRDDTADLAELTLQTPPVPEDARGTDGALLTTLRFDHGDLALDLRIRVHDTHRSLSGLVTGDFAFATVDIRYPGSADRLRVGADGRFSVSGLRRGPLSLALHRTGHPPLVTGWFAV